MDFLKSKIDEELVLLYVKGNNEAFDVLIDRHSRRLFSYVFFIVKDKDVANDVFQDTFIKAILTLQQGKYQENGKFFAWLSRIAHNLIIDYFRKERSGMLLSHDHPQLNLLNNIDLAEENTEDKMVYNQVLADVQKLVAHLPFEQQEVVLMRYYQGMSFKEIAALTGVSINTALGRMRYALINLRKLASDHQISLSWQ